MKFKFATKNNLSRLPKTTGVYAFKRGRNFLYVGKAANIKERVKNHLQQPGFRENLFVNQANKIGYLKTDSEIEALILEAKLIKKYQPKYNVMWRDDKNYFYICITKEPFPRIFITHQPKAESRIWNIEYRIKKHSTFNIQHSKFYYIGPFVDGRPLKQSLDVLRRIFPYRTCKSHSDRPCLWYQLGRCPAPCLLRSKLANEIPGLEKTIVKERSFFTELSRSESESGEEEIFFDSTHRFAWVKNESQRNARNLKKMLEGGKKQVLKNLKREMRDSSKIRNFEKAAKIRNQIRALERVMEHGKIFAWTEIQTSRKRRSPFSWIWKRIEAYDVSNIQGKDATGAMVTFINGQPDKNFYRRFKIKTEEKPNDVAMLKEVLLRRFQHPEWGLPDLILIDGGKAQLNAARHCLICQIKQWGKQIKIMSLAKRENKLFIEGRKKPVLLKTLPREIFNLILQLRDEAHRFAITYHRKLREKF